jgi:thymidylate synthase (FAD)
MNREDTSRPSVRELDEILGSAFPVLDQGFVRVIDYMGSDESIVQAARVSFGKGTKRIHEDRGLIRYLMRHSHTTPFEMCELKLHVRVPMDCWRQWIRHRTANVNEYSTRYSIAIDAAHRTEPSQWRLQSAVNRQGSSGLLESNKGTILSRHEAELHERARNVYEERLTLGVAREQARKDLPLSTYTEAYWKIDLHNLFHFLLLRLSSAAQHEIREYAKVIGYDILSKWCPVAWEAFLDYKHDAFVLSRIEIDIIQALVQGNIEHALRVAHDARLLSWEGEILRPNRERIELESKLESLGLLAIWTESLSNARNP